MNSPHKNSFDAHTGAFGYPNACPHCGESLPSRQPLRGPGDHPQGQRCPHCGGHIAYIAEELGEGRHRRLWWIPIRPEARYSPLSGREWLGPALAEWTELGGSPLRASCTLDPSRSLSPREAGRSWSRRPLDHWPLLQSTPLQNVPLQNIDEDRIRSLQVVRGMLVATTARGDLYLRDPHTGAPLRTEALHTRNALHDEPVYWPPTWRGWWMALTAERRLLIADLSPLLRDREKGRPRLQTWTLPEGETWATTPFALDADPWTGPRFGALSIDRSGRSARLVLLDAAPVREERPPRLLFEGRIDAAAAPIELPHLPGFPRAGQLLWVDTRGRMNSMDPVSGTIHGPIGAAAHLPAPGPGLSSNSGPGPGPGSGPSLPPPLRGRLQWRRTHLAVEADRDHEAVWMVQEDPAGEPILRRWSLRTESWEDRRELSRDIGAVAPWLALHPWLPEGEPGRVVVAGSAYYELHRKSGADRDPLNKADRTLGLHRSMGEDARTVGPPILTPAGLVTFHPSELRLTANHPTRPEAVVVLDRDPVPLCRAWSDFETFPCAVGSTVWCATEGGAVVRAVFSQTAS